ncbi:MAG: hypothetical protein P1U56_04585 [Saprospiraceae bacterium]|nr:hypothetical protein [Saprospiraceae bacterium]
MSKAKSIIKWVLIVFVFIGVVLFGAIKYLSEDRPKAISGQNADALAMEMFTALNKPAWDSLKFLKWEFMRGHKYLWDKKNNKAVIEWEGNKVILNLDEVDGAAFVNGENIEGEEKSKLIQEAWSYWCNDSFWMFAPFKAFDPGTSRSVVETKDGQRGLMVSYDSGGVTPGDAYLWLLNENNIPTGYKMWTSIIPIKGMYMSWENWRTLKGGAKVAVGHKSKLLSFDMKGVEEGDSPQSLGYPAGVFEI